MKITLVLILIWCVRNVLCATTNYNHSFGSDTIASRRAATTSATTFEILKKLKELDSSFEEKFIFLQSFIKFNNENIKETILEELKPEYDKWSKIVHEECIINGQFSIDQLRVLHGLHNIKKIQEINTVLSKLDFELIEKFVTIINKLK